MSAEENKAVARRFVLEHNQANYEAIHDELLGPSFAIHIAGPGMPPAMDKEAHKQFIAAFRVGLPDIRDAVEDVLGEGDRVVVRWSGTGTQTGALMGIPPTGKTVHTTGMYEFRFEEGKIAEAWNVYDLLGVLQQLGVVPSA